jgi:DNA-binding SARP family transcriptional activator
MARRPATERASVSGPDLGPLKIFAFGSLRVLRDVEEIPSAAWGRKKSRTLFAYLLCARPGRVHKEELIELLWPNADPARGTHMLQVVLSDLRAALGNGASRREGRAFIRRVGEHYSLDVGPAGWVDAEAFDRLAAIQHLQAADTLYAGEFLAEERFADWAEVRRERYRDQYVDTLQRLIRLFDYNGQLEIAVAYSKKLLAADPYLEPVYRDLMRYLKILGDQGGVVHTYLRCQQAMREGFDSDVSPETRKLAEKFLGSPLDSIVQRHATARRRSLGRHVALLRRRPPADPASGH